ncbi:unnamed protein product [Discosporangium mesarthrocarpum]
MVQEVGSEIEFRQLIGQKNKLVVVDFTATWCGPCKRVAPEFESLSTRHPDVLFLKVVEGNNKELVMTCGIRSFPTFHFYLEGQKLDQVVGANIQAVASKVEEHKRKVRHAFEGEGMSLGRGPATAGAGEGAGAPLSAQDARAARLARFGNMAPSGGTVDPDKAK